MARAISPPPGWYLWRRSAAQNWIVVRSMGGQFVVTPLHGAEQRGRTRYLNVLHWERGEWGKCVAPGPLAEYAPPYE